MMGYASTLHPSYRAGERHGHRHGQRHPDLGRARGTAPRQARQAVGRHGRADRRIVQSGSSVNKKPRLSKAGNRSLRMALLMPALSAVRHDPNVKAYTEHLICDRGLKKLQAICAVMRKLLHAIHGMLKTGSPFDSTRF